MTITENTEDNVNLDFEEVEEVAEAIEEYDYFDYGHIIVVDDDKPILEAQNASPSQATQTEPSESLCQKIRKNKTEILGTILAFVSGLIFATNSFVIQRMSLDFADTMLVRSVIFVLVIGVTCHLKQYPLWQGYSGKLRLIIIAQGILGSTMIMLAFSCLLLMPIGDACTLMFSSPLHTMIIAALVLKHRLRLFKITCGLLLFTGTILVVQPEFIFTTKEILCLDSVVILDAPDADQLVQDSDKIKVHDKYYFIGVGIALSSALCDGVLNVAINYCQSVKSLVLVFWTGMGGILVSLIAYSFDKNAKLLSIEILNIPLDHLVAYVLLSFSGILGYFFMTKSLQMTDPTVVAFVRSLEIVTAYIVQYALMGDAPNVLALVGAGLVLFSVTSMSFQRLIVQALPRSIQFLF